MKTRLDILKQERDQIKNMRCLSFNLIEECVKYYDHEILCITDFNAQNHVYEDEEKKVEPQIDFTTGTEYLVDNQGNRLELW